MVETTLGEIVGQNISDHFYKDILNDKKKVLGQLYVSSVIANKPSDNIFMKWEASGLKNVEED